MLVDCGWDGGGDTLQKLTQQYCKSVVKCVHLTVHRQATFICVQKNSQLVEPSKAAIPGSGVRPCVGQELLQCLQVNWHFAAPHRHPLTCCQGLPFGFIQAHPTADLVCFCVCRSATIRPRARGRLALAFARGKLFFKVAEMLEECLTILLVAF